jgi:GT2 family glycosyltransferase
MDDSQIYYLMNREKILKYNKERYIRNIEKILQYNRNYYLKNKIKLNKKATDYYKTHKGLTTQKKIKEEKIKSDEPLGLSIQFD